MVHYHRRLAETHVWFLPFIIVLMGVILFVGIGDVFHHWFGIERGKDLLIDHKRAWLWAMNAKDPVFDPKEGKGFFLMSFEWRNMLFISLWFVLGFLLWRFSVSQDTHGEVSTTRRLARLSAIFLVIFGLSYSANSWDLSMSLEPHWFSTMWAIYIFAGLALTTFALLVLWIWYLKGKGYYGEAVNENHWHDLGKFMWGHTIFWAYIGVSQFILIWYAHIPEETTFYHYRLYHYVDGQMVYSPWGFVSLFLAIIRFILPFFLIIKRESKRKLGYLAAVAALVIFGQIVDMYWIAYPTLLKGAKFVMFSWQELGPLLLLAGAYILTVGFFLSRTSLIPRKDPRLEECLHWHQ